MVQELSYDAWGRLRNPSNRVAYTPGSEPALFLGRGYTGHEHLTQFGLINMNARLYDPAVGRFLSPDPYVQAPDFSQNFNRYSYALNNPLKYTDPNGEFWWIVIGAVVGGVINWYAHGAEFSWRGLAAFGIGAAGGALAAATGGAVIGAFGAGGGGFIGGALSAGVAYTYGTLTTSIGNSMAFGDPMPTAEQFFKGLGVSMATGGLINGTVAAANGRNFLTGKLNLPKPTMPDLSKLYKSEISKPTLDESMEYFDSRFQNKSDIKLPDKLYKYTREYPGDWSEIRPGGDGWAYYTTDGNLGQLNSSLDLALPGYKPSFRIEIMTSDPNFNFSNIDVVRRVTGNVFGRGGGGWEILYRGSYSPSELYKWNIVEVY